MSKDGIPACVVGCMDFRIQGTMEKLISDLGLNHGDFDRIVFAGGAGNFPYLKEQLGLSAKLHNPERLVLTIHEDCGAGATKEDFKEAERIAQEVATLYGCFGTIETFFVNLDGSYSKA